MSMGPAHALAGRNGPQLGKRSTSAARHAIDTARMRSWQKWLFQAGLRLNAALTRSRRWRWIEQRVLTPLCVHLTHWLRGRSALASTPEQLGREWERLLGDPRYAHVTRVDASTQTVYGEIVGRCPLRGSGDVAACHRLMAFDRRLMARHHAHFVVLQSQAEHGKHYCQIAIRPQLLDASDLMPAHERRSG